MNRMKYFLFAFLFISFYAADAQIDLEYQQPHRDILRLADVTLPPSTRVDDKGEHAIMLYRNQYKSIAELSETEMRLGGLRINPKTNIGSRTTYYNNISVYNLKKKKEKSISGLPENPRLANIRWSPDQSKVSLTHTTDRGVELWVVDIETASAKKLTEDKLNSNMGAPQIWMKDGSALLVRFLAADRGELVDVENSVPSGPTVSVNDGKKAQNRTYQDLLKNKNDEANFEMLASSEIHRVDLSGNVTKWKETGMYRDISFSPDGKYVMVTEVKRPFSYLVPYYRFPFHTTIYDSQGDVVKVVQEVPLEEDRAQGFMSVRPGIRNVSWRADHPATMYWAEALDEGDAEKEVAFRDAIYQNKAPFTGEKQFLLQTKDRFAGMQWGTDKLAIAADYWWPTRNTRNYLFNPSNNKIKPEEFFDRNYQDQYNDPGDFVTKENKYGRETLVVDGDNLYLEGRGVSAEGIMPFIDKFNVKTKQTNRLWRAEKSNKLESIVKILDIEKGLIMESIESKSEYPNYYIRDINSTKSPKQVTDNVNPFAGIQNVHKEVITYKREDGLDLSATLYLPLGYDKASKHKLPMILWAYPQEFKDKSSAGQVTSSPNEFTYPWYGSPIFWVMRGYAVLDDAAFPIVGEEDDEPNDSFVEQLVANAKAAIDAVDEMGYIDRNRVGVGGHSYGAFMVANLLSHSDLFKAGIARSGAYNRTLTPFGFQSEERNYWEAPDVYNTMSPFMNAEKMNNALLLIHGQDDNNSGTYPMQSERYFNALKGLGATARLVMLPKESHGYRSRESILHVLWEQDEWLEKYVKNAHLQDKESKEKEGSK